MSLKGHLSVKLIGIAYFGIGYVIFYRLRKAIRLNIDIASSYNDVVCNSTAKDHKIDKIEIHERVIEVCLSDFESVSEACNGGANSVELCVDRANGGLTPSLGLIKECSDRLGSRMHIHVLIRPRAGDFSYSDDEFDIIMRDIILAKQAGAHGVVVGLLHTDNTIDTVRMGIIRAISHPMLLTFHRAFDNCADYKVALDEIVSIGCDRLLTSGCASTAEKGKDCLADIVRLAAGRIQIVAASGISPNNVKDLIMYTRVSGVHAGSSVSSVRCRICADNQLMWTMRGSHPNSLMGTNHIHYSNPNSVDKSFDTWISCDSALVSLYSNNALSAWKEICKLQHMNL